MLSVCEVEKGGGGGGGAGEVSLTEQNSGL